MFRTSTLKSALGKLAGVLMLVGIVFGLFVVGVMPFAMFEKAQAEAWPSRKGVVTLSYARHQRGWRNVLYWTPEICGSYKDNGERFCVSRIRYGGIRRGEGEALARDAVAKYPVGREVDVYYSPDNPRETVLEAVSPWTEFFAMLALAVGCLLLPAVLWVLRRKIEPARYGIG